MSYKYTMEYQIIIELTKLADREIEQKLLLNSEYYNDINVRKIYMNTTEIPNTPWHDLIMERYNEKYKSK